MTCREMLRKRYPEIEYNVMSSIIREQCPDDFDLLPEPEDCCPFTTKCDECWDREIPKEKVEACSELIFKHKGEPIAKVKETYEENGGLTAVIEPVIKDSGDRTQFESGAVRDMRVGKGRCDLMPLEVVARMFDRHDGKQGVLDYLVYFKNTNHTHFLIKALDRFALDTYGKTEKEAYTTMFLEVAKHFEDGAKKYGENNWQRGIPAHCYIDSAIRHYLKWRRGDNDENHNRAFVWNLMCCIWEVDYHNKEDNQ